MIRFLISLLLIGCAGSQYTRLSELNSSFESVAAEALAEWASPHCQAEIGPKLAFHVSEQVPNIGQDVCPEYGCAGLAWRDAARSTGRVVSYHIWLQADVATEQTIRHEVLHHVLYCEDNDSDHTHSHKLWKEYEL